MSRLLTEIKDYRGEGIAAKLFYEGKVAEAVSMVVEYQKKHPDKPVHKLSQQDIESIQTVASYLSDHYAFDIPLERLTQIACMGTTKLKSCFKKYYDCTITEYIQQRRMSQAEYLLAYTELQADLQNCSAKALDCCHWSIEKPRNESRMRARINSGACV